MIQRFLGLKSVDSVFDRRMHSGVSFSKEMADYLSTDIGDISDWKDSFFFFFIGLYLLDIFKKYDYAKKLNLKEFEEECKLVIDNLECKS